MVVKVWGKADRFELVFSCLGNDNWTASVPADLEDGQYVIELYCEDDGGNKAYWTGILYLSNSENASVRIIADKFKLWMMNEEVPELQVEPKIWLEDDKITLAISCISHVGRR